MSPLLHEPTLLLMALVGMVAQGSTGEHGGPLRLPTRLGEPLDARACLPSLSDAAQVFRIRLP
jgi:hypothetical protein